MTIGMYATDGSFGRWDPMTKIFKKDIGEIEIKAELLRNGHEL